MKNHHYPITVYTPKSFHGWFEKLPEVPPLSFFLALFFVLSGVTLAAGYLVQPSGAKGGDEIKASQHSSLIQESRAVPENGVGASGNPRFAFDAGFDVSNNNFEEKQNLANKVGLPFHVEITKKRVTMNRLYLGTFPAKKGMALYGKIKKKFPGAFVLQNRQDKTVAVFGGSFYVEEKARKEKSRLAKAGYMVKEIPSRVSLPVYAAYIGDFASTLEGEMFRQQSSTVATKEMSLVAIR